MSQHDGNLANASGSAFRADLNNALAALFSNSSGATEPSVTTAYMWWADTTANQMKIRNSANDGWITLRELDGTILMQDGSAASPSLCFRTDTDTGFYKDGDNRIGVACEGVERATFLAAGVIFNDAGNDCNFRVESSGEANMLFVDGGEDAVGIGTSTPGSYGGAVTLATARSGNNTVVIAAGTSSNSSIHFADGTSGDDAFRGIVKYEHDNNAMVFSTDASERVRISSSGDLGIGVSSPRGLVHLHSSASTRLDLTNTATGTGSGDGSTISIDGSTGALNIIQREAQPMLFNTSNTERMRIFDTGQAHHFTTTNGVMVGSTQGAGTTNWLYQGKRSRVSNTSGGATVFYVFTNGNVQNTNNSYGAISDVKLKENIVDATSQWNDLKALQVRKYNFIEGETHTQLGVIAQEVETVSPGLVNDIADRDEEGNDLGTVTKTVNYSVLYMKAVKALQEAMERIETLEAKVAALEAG